MATTKKNGISISLKFMDWFLIAYLSAQLFVPHIFGQTAYFFQPFMGVYYVIYSVIATLVAVLGIIGLIAIYVMTYTSKLDPKKEPQVPDYIPVWKFSIGMLKNAAIIYLSSVSNLGYIAIVSSLIMIYGIFYFIIQRDFYAKMTKLSLAYKE